MKILGREIAVEYCSTTRLSILANDPEAVGYFDGSTIFIKQSLTKDEKARVFLHEVMHALLGITGLTYLLEDKMEEALCNLSESYQVLIKDEEFNKHL